MAAVADLQAAEVLPEMTDAGGHEGRWVVEVGHRWGFEKANVLGELPKSEALDLAHARADEITRGDSQ